jgi:arylsulfatase A-like enzyme
MPTVLDFAGGNIPETYNGKAILPMEGISLVPVLKGKGLKEKRRCSGSMRVTGL